MPKVYLPEKPNRPLSSPTKIKTWEADNADVKSLFGRVMNFIRTEFVETGNLYEWKLSGFDSMKVKLRKFLERSTEPEAKFLLKLLHDKVIRTALYRIFHKYEKTRLYGWESEIEQIVKPRIENHLDEVKSFFRSKTPKPMSLKITRKGRPRKSVGTRTVNCSLPKDGLEITAKIGPSVAKKFMPLFLPGAKTEQRDIIASRKNALPAAEDTSEIAIKVFLVNIIKPLILEEEARIKERANADTSLDLKGARLKAIDRLLIGMENIPEPIRILCANETTRTNLRNLIYRNNYGDLKDADFAARVSNLSELTRFRAGVNGAGKPLDTNVVDKDAAPYQKKPFRPMDVKEMPGIRIRVPGR